MPARSGVWSMVVGLVMAMVVVSVVVADIEECCDGTVRFSQVRFVPPPSTAILALVEDIAGCSSNATKVGSGWVQVQFNQNGNTTTSAASSDLVKQSLEPAMPKNSGSLMSTINFSAEDKTITLSITDGGNSVWAYTYGSDVSSQLGPTWISVELQKAYFVLPNPENPTLARYTIIDLSEVPMTPVWHEFFTEDQRFISTRRGSLTSIDYYSQGFVFNEADGPCVDHVILLFTNDTVRAIDDNYFPARTISYIDPRTDYHFVETQLQSNLVQLVSYQGIDPTSTTFQMSFIDVNNLLEQESATGGGSHWWLYVLVGSIGVGLVAAIAALAYFLVVRHRRRAEAMEGQVEEYDVDKGYAEL